MFSFLKKKTQSSDISHLKSEILTLKGLHCSSCAINIDLALEDLPSVTSTTNYAKSETKVFFDSTQTNLEQIKSTIENLGYKTN